MKFWRKAPACFSLIFGAMAFHIGCECWSPRFRNDPHLNMLMARSADGHHLSKSALAGTQAVFQRASASSSAVSMLGLSPRSSTVSSPRSTIPNYSGGFLGSPGGSRSSFGNFSEATKKNALRQCRVF